MADRKFDDTTSKFLRDAYVAEVAEFGASNVTKKFNTEFFDSMRRTEVLEGFTDPQMRAKLMQDPSVYVPHAPRAEPKKAGVSKAQLVEKLNGLLPDPIDGGMKLTIADLERLIAAFDTPAE